MTLLIDTDVHEAMDPGPAVLTPYLDPIWQRYLRVEGGHWPGLGRFSLSYAMPTPKAASRPEWLDERGKSATDVSLVGRHLFEDEGISCAILNGFFHVARMDHDYEFAIALAAAYNDYQIENWLEKDLRLRGSVHVVSHRPEAAAREIDRIGSHPQVVQVFLPMVTNVEYGDPFFDPIWEAASRNELPICIHHGGHTDTVIGYPDYYVTWHTIAAPHAAQAQLASMLFQGTFDRFPELRLVILETGVSWVPWFISRANQQYKEMHSSIPWLKRLPGDHVRESVRVATQPTELEPRELEALIDAHDLAAVYVFSTDYPHFDADSPTSVIGRLREELREAIFYKNALTVYPKLERQLTANASGGSAG